MHPAIKAYSVFAQVTATKFAAPASLCDASKLEGLTNSLSAFVAHNGNPMDAQDIANEAIYYAQKCGPDQRFAYNLLFARAMKAKSEASPVGSADAIFSFNIARTAFSFLKNSPLVPTDIRTKAIDELKSMP